MSSRAYRRASAVMNCLSSQESNIDSAVKALADKWLSWDSNPTTNAEITTLLAENNEQELRKRLAKRITFGTAGLRAKMQAGFGFMNDLVVQQTCQGLSLYLEAQFGQTKAREMGLVIGFDGRHNSLSYARVTAATFLSRGFKVYLMKDQLACTPLVPYGVSTLKAAAGVMVTASHNPKQDNGYKVYWANGVQIIPPHDKGIASYILDNLPPWDITEQLKSLDSNPRVSDPQRSLADQYYKQIVDELCYTPNNNPGLKTKIVYTAMHGVGYIWAKRAFKAFNLPPFIPVPQQIEPDPEFPTVTFPNPEEGKGALALSIEVADHNGAPIILANDPDADRLAVAEKGRDGKWRVFSGNEIGVMFAAWAYKNFTKRNPHIQKKDMAMVSTAVSSSMTGAIAKKEGFQFHETLTGFKWIGNKASDLIKKGVSVLFSFEEAIGFMVGDCDCLDKDGVRAAAVMAELVGEVYGRGSNLAEYLNELYEKYGFFYITTNYFFCYDPLVMKGIFDRLRTGGKDGGYIRQMGEFTVANIRDQTTGVDTSEEDGRTKLPVTPNSQMITFYLTNGCKFTLRGSGTEPKLKYYVEVQGSNGKEAVVALHTAVSKAILQHFLRPKENNLVAPANK